MSGRRPGVGSKPLPTPVRLAVYSGACALFVVILFVRGGPNPAETDAHAVTLPTTAISHGDLGTAERETLVPNPPGYPLLMAPFVAAFGPWIGSPRWCDDKPVPDDPSQVRVRVLPVDPRALHRPTRRRSRQALSASGTAPRRFSPSSDGSCSAAGAVMLLRSTGAGGGVAEAALVVALAVLPAASDAIAQTFHPQDLMSVGFRLRRHCPRPCGDDGCGSARSSAWRSCASNSPSCRLFAVLAAAPGWRSRVRILVPAGRGCRPGRGARSTSPPRSTRCGP